MEKTENIMLRVAAAARALRHPVARPVLEHLAVPRRSLSSNHFSRMDTPINFVRARGLIARFERQRGKALTPCP